MKIITGLFTLLMTVFVVLASTSSLARAEEGKTPQQPMLTQPTVSIKYDRINFGSDTEKEWGITASDYYAIDLRFLLEPPLYGGWEIGYTKDYDLVNADGNNIKEFEYLSFSVYGMGSMLTFDGISFDLGGGVGYFWTAAKEETSD
jgi:hypothetical protein